MGVVSSKAEDGANIFLRDQGRFTIANIKVVNSRGRTLLSIDPDAFPASRYLVRREAGDESPVEYIQDPEPYTDGAPPSFLLRLNNDEELIFTITFELRQSPQQALDDGGTATVLTTSNTVVNGLTFMSASSLKELDYLSTKELHTDPNMHRNNPNVHLLGDYSTAGSAIAQAQWNWKWMPPRQMEEKAGGWRSCCTFVEYDQRLHRLDPLASFCFWVHGTQRSSHGTLSPLPRSEMASNKLRIPSAQSIDSRVSDSDGEMTSTTKDPPPSPPFEPIPEDGLSPEPNQSTSLPASAPSNKIDITLQRSGEDVSGVEDGPLFRATMKAMEQRTGSMRARWKKVLKRAEAAVEAQKANINAVADLIDALRDASRSNANAVQPAMEHYFDKIAKEMLINDRQNAANLERMIIDPITRLYNNDIKAVDAKKRDFDEESKDYYAFLGRYLGQRSDSLKEKKKQDNDKKYQDRRRNFELHRFDYSSFMQDLHGGRKDQEVLSQLTRYADAQARGYLNTAKRIEALLPQLEALSTEVSQADKDYQLQRTEREEKRRAIEKSSAAADQEMAAAVPPQQQAHGSVPSTYRHVSDASVQRSKSLAVPGAFSASTSSNGTPSHLTSTVSTGSIPHVSAFGTSPGSNRFKGYRDLEERDPSLQNQAFSGAFRKEGLVWALSRPGSHADPKGLNKQAWHKFWIVLDQGRLSEYTNWKQKLDLHMEPIDLRVASVREARNAERRFCFEIITPNFTRVYQAPNEDDMKSWIATINNALQNAVEGRGISNSLPPNGTPASGGSIRKDIASVLTGKSGSSNYRSSYAGSTSNRVPSRHATVGDRPHAHMIEVNESSQKLLQQLRDADAGNQFCADCGADQKVDWVSLNLGIIICIECSGIHRSLGTHISKVRSLTLDPNAFTPDVVELLMQIGNRVANMVWEAKLDRNYKIHAQSNREQRLRFITTKYTDRAYVQAISPTTSHFSTPDETLLAAIKMNDIQNVMYGLALKADPNTHDRSRGTHAIYLALAAADPAAPSASASPLPSPLPSIPSTGLRPGSSSGRKPFAVAELLLLNGAELPASPAPIPLSTSARIYLESKAEQRSGRKAAVQLTDDASVGTGGSGLTALPEIRGSIGPSPNDRGRERGTGDLDKLRKRVSSSGRLVKPGPPPSSYGMNSGVGGLPGGASGPGVGGSGY